MSNTKNNLYQREDPEENTTAHKMHNLHLTTSVPADEQQDHGHTGLYAVDGNGKDDTEKNTNDDDAPPSQTTNRRPSELHTPSTPFSETFASFESPSTVLASSNTGMNHSLSDVAHLPSPLTTVGSRSGRNTFTRGGTGSPIQHTMNGIIQNNNNMSNVPLPSLNVKKVRENRTNNSFNNVRFQSEYSSGVFPPEFLTDIKPTLRVPTLPVNFDLNAGIVNRDQVFGDKIIEEVEEEEQEDVQDSQEKHKVQTMDVDESFDHTVVRNTTGKPCDTYTTFDIHTNEAQTWRCCKQIGKGTFSIVYVSEGEKRAAAAIKVSNIPNDAEVEPSMKSRITASLLREINILKEINNSHPNIIELIGYNDNSHSIDNEKQVVILALPYYPHGDLFTFLLKHSLQLKSNLVARIFANIVSAVKHLHSNNIVHRDLKLENFLLTQDSQKILSSSESTTTPLIVLVDFGLSRKIDPENPMLTTRCGSDDYVSPELLLGQEYDGKQNDVWSTGVILYTMLESRLPFDPFPNVPGIPVPRYNRYKPAHRIASILWSWYHLKDVDIDENGNNYKEAKLIVEKCLIKRSKRLSIDEIYENPWISQYVM